MLSLFFSVVDAGVPVLVDPPVLVVSPLPGGAGVWLPCDTMRFEPLGRDIDCNRK